MSARRALSIAAGFLTLACGAPNSGPDLALLPLEVVDGHTRTAPLADSLRLALACRLEQQGIRVALRAVDALPSESLAPPERVGRRLGATWVLSGSVVTERERIRVVLHLTQVHDDRGAWVGSFLGALADRDTLGEEMARAVRARLQADSAVGRGTERTRGAVCNEPRVPD